MRDTGLTQRYSLKLTDTPFHLVWQVHVFLFFDSLVCHLTFCIAHRLGCELWTWF